MSEENKDLIEAACKIRDQYKSLMGLGNWLIDIGVKDIPDDEFDKNQKELKTVGNCYADARYRHAHINIDPEIDRDELEMTVVHEMFHAVLSEMDYCVYNQIIEDYVPKKWKDKAQRDYEYALERLVSGLTSTAQRLMREEYKKAKK